MSFKVIGVIPARYASSRLPGKPLADIGGKPMIQRVWERANKAKHTEKIIIATDDKRIYDSVKKFTDDVIMTPVDLKSGSDRVAFTAQNQEADIIVNIQGDEPFINSAEVDQVAEILMNDSRAVMGTLIKKIDNLQELENPNTAKVVIDREGYALYFSRAPIPFNRNVPDTKEWLNHGTYYKHIGIYSYRKDFLQTFFKCEYSLLEKVEKLEQLRVLENGYKIKTAVTDYEPMCVDTKEDLQKAREKISYRNGVQI